MTFQPTLRVHALVPWALLETIRQLDTPPDDGMDEFHPELAGKRLGISPTVAAQIHRLQEQAERGGRVPVDEAAALFRLVCRRGDAERVFAEAGRWAAEWTARRAGVGRRAVRTILPGALGRFYGYRTARRQLKRYFGLVAVRDEQRSVLVTHPGGLPATATGDACTFFGTAVAALLERCADFKGTLIHARCLARGDDACVWRAGTTGEERSDAS